MAMQQIGTVELLRERVYALDTEAAKRGSGPWLTEVLVPAGIYPVMSDGVSICWLMAGNINTRGVHRRGDGILSVIGGDTGDGVQVTFPSITYGPDEFWALQCEPVSQRGPQQRLVFRLEQQPHEVQS